MTKIRVIKQHINIVLISMIIYFCFDYFVYKTLFLQAYSFVGLKSFLPMVLGLNFGIYGVIGELIAILIKKVLVNTTTVFLIVESLIIVIIGIGTWFLWHIKSTTDKIHLRYLLDYIRYIVLIVFLSFICGIIGLKLVNSFAFKEILMWNVFMSILVGLPVEIIYGSLMNLNPILPPLYHGGKRIELTYDIRCQVTAETTSFNTFFSKLEELLERKNVDVKRIFEIQNITEEIYLRIIKKYQNITIDIKANYDITFSIEFLYIENKYNPFRIEKGEEKVDVAGLKLIKHRALLASYGYDCGLNYVHIVV